VSIPDCPYCPGVVTIRALQPVTARGKFAGAFQEWLSMKRVSTRPLTERDYQRALDALPPLAGARDFAAHPSVRAYPGLGYTFTVPLQQQWLLVHGELPPVLPIQAAPPASAGDRSSIRRRIRAVAALGTSPAGRCSV